MHRSIITILCSCCSLSFCMYDYIQYFILLYFYTILYLFIILKKLVNNNGANMFHTPSNFSEKDVFKTINVKASQRSKCLREKMFHFIYWRHFNSYSFHKGFSISVDCLDRIISQKQLVLKIFNPFCVHNTA